MSIKKAFNLVGAYFFRWVGFSTEPDIIKVGNPNRKSPVFLTSNFSLTVKRVLKAIKGINCYLLIAPSKGINVWCGACGDDFKTDSVISIIKTSEINDLVDHRMLILPQLSAPGIDPLIVKKELGWDIKFGPVYAKDIPDYVVNNFNKTEQMREVKFTISKRIEMANIYFFSLFLILSLVFWITAIFLTFLNFLLFLDSMVVMIIVIYGALIILPSIETEKGRIKTILFEGLVFALIFLFYIFVLTNLFYLVWNTIVILLLTLILVEDFNGLTPTYKSELGERIWKKGEDKMKFLFGEYKLQPYGQINIEIEKCIGCKICIEVCPKNLYTFNENDKKVYIKNSKQCINCNACVKRCLGHCLNII